MIKLTRPICPNPAVLIKNYKHPDNKKALSDASFNKCMYCEAFVTDVSFGDIEHIKPKTKFKVLEFDWSNLGFTCSRCNNSKGDKYEDTLPYINPYEEEPADMLVASGAYLLQKQGSTRGELTIRDISLNRQGLLEKRQELIDRLQKTIDKCFRTPEPLKGILIAELQHEASIEKEYSFVAKARLSLESL